jgi:hypothetical protein
MKGDYNINVRYGDGMNIALAAGKGNILALIHLKVLLLNNYEIFSKYEYTFGDNHVQSRSMGKYFGYPGL